MNKEAELEIEILTAYAFGYAVLVKTDNPICPYCIQDPSISTKLETFKFSDRESALRFAFEWGIQLIDLTGETVIE